MSLCLFYVHVFADVFACIEEQLASRNYYPPVLHKKQTGWKNSALPGSKDSPKSGFDLRIFMQTEEHAMPGWWLKDAQYREYLRLLFRIIIIIESLILPLYLIFKEIMNDSDYSLFSQFTARPVSKKCPRILFFGHLCALFSWLPFLPSLFITLRSWDISFVLWRAKFYAPRAASWISSRVTIPRSFPIHDLFSARDVQGAKRNMISFRGKQLFPGRIVSSS